MDNFKIPHEFLSCKAHERTIVHIDIDCFYAQVEMIRKPDLRCKPLGIQQKNIVVTCNYEARKFGVGKLMSITEAYKHCPSLVLVSGEDLTHYRTFSNKVTALLQNRFSALVERLGFDENFIDISDLVTTRLKTCNNKNVIGHVYSASPDPEQYCRCGCSERLIIGSQIAAEMRQQIYDEFSLTTCGGIAYNKVLAKLVGEIHKPNQQTTLFHNSAIELLTTLPSIQAIPGIGRKIAETIKNKLAVSSVESLQMCSIEQLAAVLGSSEQAQVILKLSFGIDDSEVKASGKPQSIGVEDAFKEIRTLQNVETKMASLLKHLLELLFKEEPVRSPGTLRVSLRKYNKNWHESSRESRQCSIPTLPSEINKCEDKLMPMVMELFRKMVNPSVPFHLTLLGIAFTNLTEPKKGRASILTFMEASTSSKKIKIVPEDDKCSDLSNQWKASTSATNVVLPPGVDAEIFNQLPSSLQQEILTDWEQQQAQRTKIVNPKKKSKNSIKNYFKK